jgi:ABC-2 type transport system permease protein
MALKFDVGAFGQLLFSVLSLVLSAIQLDLHWGIAKWLVFLGTLVGGTLIQGGILIFISGLAFFTTRSERFYWAVMLPAKRLINYPLSIYPRVVQWVIAFIVPFAFVNYFPALILLDKSDPHFAQNYGLLSPVVGIVFFYLCYRFWMFGVNRYKSAGS